MHNLGIFNLSFVNIDKNDTVHNLMNKKRNADCRARETNKRVKRVEVRVSRFGVENTKIRKLLRVAESQVTAFRSSHPEWVTPEKVLMSNQHDDELNVLFKVLLFFCYCVLSIVYISDITSCTRDRKLTRILTSRNR